MLNRSTVSIAVGLALGALGNGASAAGFALMEQNASGIGNAFAGAAASAEDAGTIYFNPAGMTRVRGRQVVGALSLVAPSAKFSNSGASTVPPLQSPGGGNGGDAGGVAAVPAGYLSWELQPDKLWLGISLNSPFGLSTEWDSGWQGRFHGIESSVEALTINPSIAWKVNDQLSLGGGVSLQRMSATFTNATPYSLLAASLSIPGVGAGREGVAKVEGDSTAWGWNVGAMFQASPSTRIGASYRSEIKHDIEGDVTFADRPAQLGAVVPDGPAQAKVKLPATFSLAIAHDVNARWQVLADYTWTGWDSIQQLAITRPTGQPISSVNLAFKDSWRVGLGANYRVDEQWTLRFGTAYDTTPVQDAYRTPRLPDSDKIWASIGAQWRASPNLAIDTGFAYIWIDDGPSNLTSASAGNLVGEYKSYTWVLGAQVRYNF